MAQIKTRTVAAKYFKAGEVTPPFNSIMFSNEGSTTVVLNGLTIAPGAVYSDNGFEGEYNYTIYRWTFVGAGVNRLIVVKKEIV